MKFIIALAFLAVVSAFPPSPKFSGYRNDDYQLRKPRLKANILPQNNNELLKAYEQLIENLSRLSRGDEGEEVVNGFIESIISIGQIINSNGFDDRLPRPQKPRPGDQQGDVSKRPSKKPDNVVSTPSVPQSNEEIPSSSDQPLSSTSSDINVSSSDEYQGSSSVVNEPVNESEEAFTQSNEEIPRIAY